jgi:hypothetical protein
VSTAPVPPPFDDEKCASGFQAAAGARVSSSGALAGGFTELQQAGLAAMIGLARVDANPLPAVRHSGPRASAPGRAADTAPAQAEVIALTAPGKNEPIADARTPRVLPDRLPTTGAHAGGTRVPSWHTRVPWPLVAILAVQVVMAARLIWSNTAFTDEATYLYAGSQELRHWLYGSPVENYQTVMSGSPALYPPVGAIANAVGGLAATRILSLLFLIGTSTLLYATTSRLFGKSAAMLGTALFAALGVTQFLSAFAIYDPMALFLLALGTYLIIGRRSDGSLAAATLSGLAAPLTLALANATKYATVLWDPVVIGLCICAPVLAGRTWRYGAERAAKFTAVLIAVLGIGLAIGKAKYLHGIFITTFVRSQSMTGVGQSAGLTMHSTWEWAGAVFVIAAAGFVMQVIPRFRPASAVGALLLLAALAAPLDQALTGTSASSQRNVVFGAWFGCMLAGLALARVLRHPLLIGACGFALITVLPVGYARQATSLYHSWPTENPGFIDALRAMTRPGSQRYLIEGDADIPAYYIGPRVKAIQWTETGTSPYTGTATGITSLSAAAIPGAIKHRVFTLIILNVLPPPTAEERNSYFGALETVRYSGSYHFAGQLPPATIGSHDSYTVWQLNAAPRQRA